MGAHRKTHRPYEKRVLSLSGPKMEWKDPAVPLYFLTTFLVESRVESAIKLLKGASMEGISKIPETLSVLPPMSNQDIVRAWKDAGYRRRLSAEQLQWLPAHPAG